MPSKGERPKGGRIAPADHGLPSFASVLPPNQGASLWRAEQTHTNVHAHARSRGCQRLYHAQIHLEIVLHSRMFLGALLPSLLDVRVELCVEGVQKSSARRRAPSSPVDDECTRLLLLLRFRALFVDGLLGLVNFVLLLGNELSTESVVR